MQAIPVGVVDQLNLLVVDLLVVHAFLAVKHQVHQRGIAVHQVQILHSRLGLAGLRDREHGPAGLVRHQILVLQDDLAQLKVRYIRRLVGPVHLHGLDVVALQRLGEHQEFARAENLVVVKIGICRFRRDIAGFRPLAHQADMGFLLICFINAVDGFVKLAVLIGGHLHVQRIALDSGPFMDPGFVRPAVLFHQVGIAVREHFLVLGQIGFQLFRGFHRILFRIPADLLGCRLVHNQAAGHAQFLVGRNTVQHTVELCAVQECLR